MQGMMFTMRAINSLGRALRWFYAIRVSPLKWDNQSQCLNVANSKLHLIAVVTGICLYLLYTVNTTYSMLERSVQGSFLGKSDLAFNLSWCFFFGTTAAAVCSTWSKRKEISGYASNFLRLDRQFAGTHIYETVSTLIIRWIVGLL